MRQRCPVGFAIQCAVEAGTHRRACEHVAADRRHQAGRHRRNCPVTAALLRSTVTLEYELLELTDGFAQVTVRSVRPGRRCRLTQQAISTIADTALGQVRKQHAVVSQQIISAQSRRASRRKRCEARTGIEA